MGLFNAIFSTSFGFAVLRVTTPIIFAALAALITNKAGVMNIALEGIMLMSAFFGAIVSSYTQSALLGVLVAMLAGVCVAMIMAGFAFKMKADLILTGIALNTFASGATVFLLYVICNDKASTSNLPSCNVPAIDIPIIQNIPVIGEIFSGHNLLTYLAFVSVYIVYILVYKTSLGLRIRAVGENPDAARSVGINVVNIQFAALFLSGIFAGLGGAFMSMGYMSFFSRDMVAGRGFIALAAQNMGGAAPLGTLIASLIFGMADALSNMLQTLRVPAEVVQMQPYLLTIVGLVIYAVSTGKKKKSKAD
ncbi:ABC transporter permease [Lachnospiraceae bacterium 62-35]